MTTRNCFSAFIGKKPRMSPRCRKTDDLVVGEAGFDVEIGEGERFLEGPPGEGDPSRWRTVLCGPSQPISQRTRRRSSAPPSVRRSTASTPAASCVKPVSSTPRSAGNAEAGQAFRQEAFRFRLRQDEGVVEAAREPVEAHVNDSFALAEDVDAMERPAGRHGRVGDPDAVEVLQRPRLHGQRLGGLRRLRRLVDDPARTPMRVSSMAIARPVGPAPTTSTSTPRLSTDDMVLPPRYSASVPDRLRSPPRFVIARRAGKPVP